MKDIAIVTYIDKNERLIREFNWLYKSWVSSGSMFMSDLLVFHHPDVKIENKEIRTIPLTPLSNDYNWSSYPFINSVYFLTTQEAQILRDYKYVLRTDHDVFLTPNFPKLRPRLATFGLGMYSQVSTVAKKLIEIAEKWGILPQYNNIGSTFIAKSELALDYCKLQLEYCTRLRDEEFPDGDGEWPNWFKGVLSMYAGNLAANAFFGSNMTFGGLDCHCMSQDEMCNSDYHIHAWHTYSYFSKFVWHTGGYKDIDIYSLNHRQIANYCLFIAGATP